MASLQNETSTSTNGNATSDRNHLIASDSVATGFNFLKQIGQGSFGKIYLAEKKDSGIYAIKRVNRKDDSNVATEIKVLKKMKNSPYIVQIHDVVLDPIDVYIVLEFIPGGDMYNYINTFGKLALNQARIWASEIAYALNSLHDMDILYGDLKIENLCIDARGHIVLTDFGLSSILAAPYKAYKISGTFHYMAPEIFSKEDYQNREGYSFEVDWWALGIVLYEMLSGEQLYDISYQNMSSDHVKQKLMTRIYLKNIENKVGDAQAADIIYRLNEKDPRLRLGRNFNDVKKHSFFNSIIWSDVAQNNGSVIYTPTLTDAFDTRNFEAQFAEQTVSHETLTASRNSISDLDSLIFGDDSMTPSIKSDNIDLIAIDERAQNPVNEVNSRKSQNNIIEIEEQLHQPAVAVPRQLRKRAQATIDCKSSKLNDVKYSVGVVIRGVGVNKPKKKPNDSLHRPPHIPMDSRVTSSNRTVLFNSIKQGDKSDSPLFVKTLGSNGMMLKMFDNGPFIELDERKCLKWIERHAAALVEACAVKQKSVDCTSERRSGRIARMRKINYRDQKRPEHHHEP